MTPKPQSKPKTEASRHVPAFHVKQGPLDTLDTIKRLRQIRHGLENAQDPTSKHLVEARDKVDAAITQLTQYVFLHENHHNQADAPESHRNLAGMT